MDSPQKNCPKPILNDTSYIEPEWKAILTGLTLSIIIVITIVGNILVILSVFSYKRLRIVQNFFIVSLAVADITVAILVLPFNVAYMILGQWVFGITLCKMWLTCDILCCTASILNLCAIALDRYWAITDPINYSQQRTLNRVLGMIGGVWILSAIISSPPLLGWNNWKNMDTQICVLSQDQGFVVFSSLGSFFIPLFIMTIVYVEIFIATRRRLRERANASRMTMMKHNAATPNQQAPILNPEGQNVLTTDQDSETSETNNCEHSQLEELPHSSTQEKKNRIKQKHVNKTKSLSFTIVTEDLISDNVDSASGSNYRNSLNPAEKRCTTTLNTELIVLQNTDLIDSAPTDVIVPPLKKQVVVNQFVEAKQRISLSKERRAARTLGIIMGVFVICWLPFFLLYVIDPFCIECCPSEALIHFITWLGYINSALNPIIYTIFNLDFRRAFKILLHIKS